MNEVNSIKDLMNERNSVIQFTDKHPKLVVGLAVVGGVIIVSVGVINILSSATEKINNLTTQLSDLRSNYRNLVDYINNVERCSCCSNPHRRKKCLDRHEYICGNICGITSFINQ